MERIVLDTNCLLKVVPKNSTSRIVWDKILSDDVVLCVSTEILFEYTEVLTEMINKDIAERIVTAITLRSGTIFVSPHYHWQLITSDPDDNKFVDCAIAANAKYVVSDDKHFKVLKRSKFPPIELKTLQEYVEHLNDIYNTLSGIDKRRKRK